jgi:lysyl oxidase/WD40 repeat protein
VIAAVAAAAAVRPEPRGARLLVEAGSTVVAQAPDGTRTKLLAGEDAAYSPDGTLLAFARAGDLWLANADGSGVRRLSATPNVVEWKPQWLANGQALVYTASVEGKRQIRLLRLADLTTQRLAASDAEEYGATVSASGRLAFVSTRSGTPAVYVADARGTGATLFDTTPPAAPYLAVFGPTWSPDGKRLAYAADPTPPDPAVPVPRAIVVDDGTTQTVLAAGDDPAWSPTGTRIAFAGAAGLQSVALDGTDVRAIGSGSPLDWQTVPVGGPVFPNLVQRPPSGLVVSGSRGHWRLGFTSMVDNRGPGVLWIQGTRAPGAPRMEVRQLIALRTGGARADPNSGELHYTVAPPHYHWHFLGFDRFELHRVGDLKLLVRDHKSGFCIADHYGTAIGVPHGPPRFLGSCAQFDPKARFVEEGASVGYTDRYPAFFHGQGLDITKVPAGRYWLVHRANPDFHLRETRYDDDVASLLVRISWHGGAPTVTTLRTCNRATC